MSTRLNSIVLGAAVVFMLAGCVAGPTVSESVPDESPAPAETNQTTATLDPQDVYLCGALDAGARLVSEYVYRYNSGELTDDEVPQAIGVVRAVFNSTADPAAAPASTGTAADVHAATEFAAVATSFGNESTGFGGSEWEAARMQAVNACSIDDIFPGTDASGG
jgi:hypothetical protein